VRRAALELQERARTGDGSGDTEGEEEGTKHGASVHRDCCDPEKRGSEQCDGRVGALATEYT